MGRKEDYKNIVDLIKSMRRYSIFNKLFGLSQVVLAVLAGHSGMQAVIPLHVLAFLFIMWTDINNSRGLEEMLEIKKYMEQWEMENDGSA